PRQTLARGRRCIPHTARENARPRLVHLLAPDAAGRDFADQYRLARGTPLMPEILLFKRDHSTQSVPTPSAAQLAALPKVSDLITWQADGWTWGHEELTSAW